MRVAGLFAGIGGIELGMREAGLQTSFLCEIDPQAQAVLRNEFPGTRLVSDVRSIERLPRNVDLLTAGFPCQDLSQVGRTSGIHGRQSSQVREVFRILSKTPPDWVLIENVPFLLRLDRGRGIRYIVSNLERLGYRWAYRVMDTRAFGLPHRRERVYLLASRVDDPGKVLFGKDHEPETLETDPTLAHGFYWTEGTRGLGWAVDAVPTIKGGSGLGIPSPPAIWFPDGSFGTPDIRDAERLQGFEADWTIPAESKGRATHRWTLVGNAVSVPVARWIGTRLLKTPSKWNCSTRELEHSERWPSAAFGGPGSPRCEALVGTFPVRRRRKHLEQYLRFEPKPLSLRAAGGFLRRLTASSLSLSRSEPFVSALTRYVRHAS